MSNKFKCAKCGKEVGLKNSLNRHIREQHQPRPEKYKCGICGIFFVRQISLKAHIDSKHTIKETSGFVCAICSKSYTRKSNLREHIFVQHMENETFVCYHCNAAFNSKKNIKKHISENHHPSRNKITSRVGCLTCPLCYESFPTQRVISLHFEKVHNLAVTMQTYSFETEDAFKRWKTDLEKQCYCTYRKRDFKRNRNTIKESYVCNRSGFYTPVQTRKRKLKMQGSQKINGFCPSNIIVYITVDGFRKVKFTGTHVGHSTDWKQVAHMRYSEDEKKIVAQKLAAGIPTKRVIDDIISVSSEVKPSSSLQKIDLLNEKDIRNIAMQYNIDIKQGVRGHPQDVIGVESWVETNAESTCFYKCQGEADKSPYGLYEDDFVLIIMKEDQIQKFYQYHSNAILVDGPRAIGKKTDFHLHTVLVLDSYGEGYPTCFLITNRNDNLPIDIMFSCIREKFGAVTTRVLMSNIPLTYYDSWIYVMKIEPEIHLFCSWHVTHEWQKHYSKIKSADKRKALRERLIKLLYENNVYKFHELLEDFLQNDDEDLQSFICYFGATYGSNYQKWACCYRMHAGVNTNMSLEHFHRQMKYSEAHGLGIQQVQNILDRLDLYFLRRKLVDIRADAVGGKLSYKVQALRQCHEKAVQNLETCQITEIDAGNLWTIASLTDEEESYTLKRVGETCASCPCPLLCLDCQFCFHQFTCSCLQNSIRSIMCKHIHLLCMTGMQDVVPVYDLLEEVQVPFSPKYEQADTLVENKVEPIVQSQNDEVEESKDGIVGTSEIKSDLDEEKLLMKTQFSDMIESCNEEKLEYMKLYFKKLNSF